MAGRRVLLGAPLAALAFLAACTRAAPSAPAAPPVDARPAAAAEPDVASPIDTGIAPDVVAIEDAALDVVVDESQFVPLNMSAVGRGQGFWCYQTAGRTSTEELCFRAQSMCSSMRRSSIDRGERTTECAREESAWCSSFRGGIPAVTVAVCTPERLGYATCVRGRIELIEANRRFVQYRNLSRCELVH